MTIIIVILIILLLILAVFVVKMTKEKYSHGRENYFVDISAGIPPECDCHYNYVGKESDPLLWTYKNIHPTDYETEGDLERCT